MTDYTKATNFATKDSLPSGNPAKIVKGTEIDTKFNNIATAIATKANRASPTFTGTLTAADMAVTGDLTVTGDATISGNLTFGDAATDTINLAADIASNILPSADNTYDIGAIGAEWKDLYINGVAYVDAIDFAGTSITATGAELNTLDGITANVTELNYTDGVTSNIQTQLDNKQPLSAVLTATTASFTTADETKLDAIEAGATADQTASEILTAVKTVDGTGSGLDADLLDGNEATAFATAAQGTLADSALQSSDIGSSVLAYDSNLQSFVTTFTLPTTDSTAGYVLKTDGAGALSFVAQSAYDESTVAITGGTIDGTVIGGTTPAAGSFTTGSFTGTLASGALTVTGNATVTNDLLFTGANPEIQGGDTDGGLYISGSTAANLGGNLTLFGDTNATRANDYRFRSAGTEVYGYDASAASHNFTGNQTITSSATTATGMVISADVATSSNILFSDTSSASFSGNAIYARINNASATGYGIRVANEGTGNGVFIDQNGNGTALEIDTETTTSYGLYVNANVLTT